MTDPGFERTLRHALHTELSLRLRHTLMHSLKGPVQTILSALHLLQKRVAAGDLQELDKYAAWIKSAAHDLVERAQTIVPNKPLADGEPVCADLHLLTDDVMHLLRDEAALKAVELHIATPTGSSLARIPPADMRLALQAILFGVVDAMPANAQAHIASRQTGAHVEWTIDASAGSKPSAKAFEPRYDVLPPTSGIAWHVARATVEESGGQFFVENGTAGGWRIRLSLPGV